MKADKYSKIASYSLYALFAVILVVLAMFFFAGESQQFVVEGEEAQAQMKPLFFPEYTDALIILCYVMLALSLTLVVLFGLMAFVRNLIDDAAAAIKGLVTTLIFAAVVVLVFIFSGSTVDAVIYLQYILLAVCVVCSIFGMAGYKRTVGK